MTFQKDCMSSENLHRRWARDNRSRCSHAKNDTTIPTLPNLPTEMSTLQIGWRDMLRLIRYPRFPPYRELAFYPAAKFRDITGWKSLISRVKNRRHATHATSMRTSAFWCYWHGNQRQQKIVNLPTNRSVSAMVTDSDADCEIESHKRNLEIDCDSW